MIVAVTGMERMPERCGECELCDMDWGECGMLGTAANPNGRREDCPLTEIDETLPAQLAAAKADVAAAEARIKKLDRLLDESL